MTAWLADRCSCPTCKARRTEDPPERPGCECPECQPGAGLHVTKATLSRLDELLGEVVRVTCREWCVACRDNVVVHAEKLPVSGWSNVCVRGHTWTSFE